MNNRAQQHFKSQGKRGLNEAEAATYIGLSRSFLRTSRMDGPRKNHAPAPRFIRIGRCIRYLIDDLDDYLNQFSKHDGPETNFAHPVL